MKWFFYAKQLDCTNPQKQRTFKVNRKSGDAIISKIRELGTTVLRIDREGDDKDTFYRPSAVPVEDR